MSEWTPEKLKEHRRKIRDFIATTDFFTRKSACRWCMTVYHNKYDLGWGNRYEKYSYDSKECQELDAKSRGWKSLGEEEES